MSKSVPVRVREAGHVWWGHRTGSHCLTKRQSGAQARVCAPWCALDGHTVSCLKWSASALQGAGALSTTPEPCVLKHCVPEPEPEHQLQLCS